MEIEPLRPFPEGETLIELMRLGEEARRKMEHPRAMGLPPKFVTVAHDRVADAEALERSLRLP